MERHFLDGIIIGPPDREDLSVPRLENLGKMAAPLLQAGAFADSRPRAGAGSAWLASRIS